MGVVYCPSSQASFQMNSVAFVGEIKTSQRFRQYLQNDLDTEPRLHFLLSVHVVCEKMNVSGPGYQYLGICMKAIPIDILTSLSTFCTALANKMKVPLWNIGAEVICYYRDGGISWYSDNAQGEKLIATIVLQIGVKPHPIWVKCKYPDEDGRVFKIHIGQGSGYAMNGIMQLHYVHSVPKLA